MGRYRYPQKPQAGRPYPPTYGRKPKFRKEEQEYGAGKEDIVICPRDYLIYYNKSWHHNTKGYKVTQDKNVDFKLCPADEMKKDGRFEGQVLVRNIPKKLVQEVRRLIENAANRAWQRDPLDRILVFRKTGPSSFEVRTSENQLAVSIGKQIVRAYKNAGLDIQWSDKESVARVYVNFPR